MQSKTAFPRLAVVKELPSTKNQSRAKLQSKTKTSLPLQKFQNLVSTITMTRALRNRSQLRKQNTTEDLGEFHMSHATSPDDDDRRPDTTLTDPSTIRTDVLSRLNMSDHFRFTTRPNRKFQVSCNLFGENQFFFLSNTKHSNFLENYYTHILIF